MSDPDLEGFLDDEDDDEDETPTAAQAQPQRESNEFATVRRKLREETKARKAAEARVAELEPIKEQFVAIQKPKAFEEAGVESRFAQFYDGPLTPEDIKTWASGHELIPTEEPPDMPQGVPTGFTPTLGGNSPGSSKVPRAQVDEMFATGREAEAMALIAQGRVEYENL